MDVRTVMGLVLDFWAQLGVVNVVGALVVIAAAITALSYLRR